jgi:ribosomal protein S27AE
MAENRMRCTQCGELMNHHADKIICDSPEISSPFFGLVEELHQCPGCGAAASRPEVVGDGV